VQIKCVVNRRCYIEVRTTFEGIRKYSQGLSEETIGEYHEQLAVLLSSPVRRYSPAAPSGMFSVAQLAST
jgi:hypothetical protein